jgi:hypothetical protein
MLCSVTAQGNLGYSAVFQCYDQSLRDLDTDLVGSGLFLPGLEILTGSGSGSEPTESVP